MRKIILFCFITLLTLVSIDLHSHGINQSYVYLRVYEDHVDGRFEINTAELSLIIGKEISEDITLEELNTYLEVIKSYYLDRVKFSSVNGPHPFKITKLGLLNVGDNLGTFVLVYYEVSNIEVIPDELTLNYNVLFDRIEDHKGLMMIEYNWKAGVFNNEGIPSLFFSKSSTADTVNLTEGSVMKGFLGMIREGIWHIWIGLDHILFLFALILPSVITRNFSMGDRKDLSLRTLIPSMINQPVPSLWTPVYKFKPAFIYIIKIITFFTIGHTVTLALAALDIIILPSRLVESIIAISIALAAVNNIWPIFKSKEWIIALGFGLFHGFGFASVLGDIKSGEYLGLTLLGFNLGVEIGQVVIISMIFPVLFFLRKTKTYNFLMAFASLLLILISLYWFVERAIDYDIKLGQIFRSIYDRFLG